jgi:putative transposase
MAQRPPFHVHHTPTYASWLNQVERWFGIITQRTIRRGSFSSVKELIARIEQFVTTYNKNTSTFIWTATPDSILEKLQKPCSRISGTVH